MDAVEVGAGTEVDRTAEAHLLDIVGAKGDTTIAVIEIGGEGVTVGAEVDLAATVVGATGGTGIEEIEIVTGIVGVGDVAAAEVRGDHRVTVEVGASV